MSDNARTELVTKRASKKERRDELMARQEELMAKSGGEAINAEFRTEFGNLGEEVTQLRKEIEYLDGRISELPAKASNEEMEILTAGGNKPGETPFRRWLAERMNAGGGLSAEEKSKFLSENGGFRGDLLFEESAARQVAAIEAAEGVGLMTAEEAKRARAQLIVEGNRYGAFSTPADGDGVPTTTMPVVQKELKSFKGIRPLATIRRTPMGEPLEIPVYSDEDRVGQFVAEDPSSDAQTDDGVDMNVVTFDSHPLNSKLFTVSRKLLLNAAYDAESFVRSQLMRSLAKSENAAYSSGSGTNQPTGYQGLADTGLTATNQTSFTYEELIELLHSLDIAYRYGDGEGAGGLSNPIGGKGACWVMHDTVLGYIRTLFDNSGRNLWERDYRMGAPDTLFGFPIQIDQNATPLTELTPSASQSLVYFGDFSYYLIRESGPMTVDLVLDYTRVGRNNVGMIMWAYRDGNVAAPRNSGNDVECIQKLVTASS